MVRAEGIVGMPSALDSGLWAWQGRGGLRWVVCLFFGGPTPGTSLSSLCAELPNERRGEFLQLLRSAMP